MTVSDRPPYQRAVGQDLNGLQDFTDALGRSARIKLGDVVKVAVKSSKTCGDSAMRAMRALKS